MDEVYTLKEVAEKMKISIQVITKIVKSGKMKSTLFGRQYRITETALNEYLNGIYGDTPIQQTRKVNPAEKNRRKPSSQVPEPEDLPVENAVEPEGLTEKAMQVWDRIEEMKVLNEQPKVSNALPEPNSEPNIDLLTDVPSVAETEAKLLELILQLKRKGLSLVAISNKLNELGHTTTKGKAFTKGIVDGIIRKYQEK